MRRAGRNKRAISSGRMTPTIIEFYEKIFSHSVGAFSMNNIEILGDHFQGGAAGGQNISEDDITHVLAEALKAVLYNNVRLETQPSVPDRIYRDNHSFWQDAIASKHFPGTIIVLENFHLTEWVPFSPGLYYTPDAIWMRRNASQYISHERDEYTIKGKISMVQGGIGTVRLAEKTIAGQKICFLGASSTGIGHQGIPVALPIAEYCKLMSPIREQGGCLATITGSLHSLTEEMPSLQYGREIPRYCFFAEEVLLHKVSDKSDLLTTVAIMFTTENIHGYRRNDTEDDTITNKSWTFCSFHPQEAQQDVQLAAEWLTDYAKRYTSTEPYILTDFDEQYRLFPSVEFPLCKIVRGEVDLERLRAYRDQVVMYGGTYIDKYFKEMIMGDKIDVNGSGNTIVNRSTVQNAFNKVKSQYDDATAETLKVIEAEINRSGNTEAAENFDSFNEELQKPEPKKSILKSLWQGTVTLLPTLLQLPGVMENIKQLLGPSP